MTSTTNVIPVLLVGLLATVVATAAGSQWHGMRGPLPEEQRELIHLMAGEHAQIEREVVFTDSGYIATTTSDNPELVAALHEHVDYMKRRLDSGAMVRRWDPAFRELVEYHEDLVTKIVMLDNGLQVEVKGLTEDAVEVAWNHGRIISGFVSEGMKAVGSEHPTATERGP